MDKLGEDRSIVAIKPGEKVFLMRHLLAVPSGQFIAMQAFKKGQFRDMQLNAESERSSFFAILTPQKD